MLDFTASGARPREPMFFMPGAVLALVAALLAIHAALSFAPVMTQEAAYLDWGFIPGRVTISIWPDRLMQLLAGANTDSHALDAARLWLSRAAAHSRLTPL